MVFFRTLQTAAKRSAMFQARSITALSPATINIIKATAPVVAEHGYAITSTMYGSMLTSNDEVRALFNPSHQKIMPGESHARQPSALAASVAAYAANIDNLGVLAAAVERIAQKHVALYILPEHYPIVGTHLIGAIKKVLGDAATPEIVQAWTEAYGLLADILIERERTVREAKAAAVGGWAGWRDFKVAEKIVESTELTSFVLRPADGGPVLPFEAGQYLGLRFDTPEFTTQRNYSLSNAPNDKEYQITIKRQGPAAPGCPMGQISTYLHDQIQVGDVLKVGVPCGDFVLEVHDDKPIVLLSGGVGITPLASMVGDLLLTKRITTPVTLINVVRNPEVEAMHDAFVSYAKTYPNFRFHTLYGEFPATKVDATTLQGMIDNLDAHFYFCGPPGFMHTVEHILSDDWKIPADQVHFEYFGPHQS